MILKAETRKTKAAGGRGLRHFLLHRQKHAKQKPPEGGGFAIFCCILVRTCIDISIDSRYLLGLPSVQYLP